MHLFAGSVGVANSMQYLVLLPCLALVHRGELFIQSRTHVACKDGAHAERHPKRYYFSKSVPSDRLVTQKAEHVVDVGSML